MKLLSLAAVEVVKMTTSRTAGDENFHSTFVPSQWEMLLQSNAVSHSLGANLNSALYEILPI